MASAGQISDLPDKVYPPPRSFSIVPLLTSYTVYKMHKSTSCPCLSSFKSTPNLSTLPVKKSVSTNVLPAGSELVFLESMIERKIEYQAVLRTPFHQLEACTAEHMNKSIDDIFTGNSTDDDTANFASCLATPPDYDTGDKTDCLKQNRSSLNMRNQARVAEWLLRIRRQRKQKRDDNYGMWF